MARDLHGAIAERAPKSLGVFTNGQLDALGLSRQQRRTLLSKGVLVPMGGGVVRHAAHPTSWQQRILAAVLAAAKAPSHPTGPPRRCGGSMASSTRTR
jgi:hypothetical protein